MRHSALRQSIVTQSVIYGVFFTLRVTHKPIILSVVTLNAIMLSVVLPLLLSLTIKKSFLTLILWNFYNTVL
jgi:hypothetical protein